VVVWTTSRRCNLHCLHCYTGSEDVNYPGELSTDEGYALLDDLAAFGVPALLMSGGEPLYRPDFELDFIFDLARRYGLKKRLRLGIAHPIPGAPNESIRVEDIGRVIERLYAYKDAFDKLGLRPSFDCGFPLCRITDEQLGWLTRLSGHEL